MPVRKVSHHGKNIIGRFPSVKLERMVAYESLLELDFLYLLDFERDVITYEEQPVTIDYEHNRKQLRYTPDFYIEKAERWLIECKPAALIQREDNQLKFSAAAAWCDMKGWKFAVATEVEIRKDPYLQNVKTLTRYARLAITHSLIARTNECLRNSPISIGELAIQLNPANPRLAEIEILGMAFHFQVAITIQNAPISRQMMVSRME